MTVPPTIREAIDGGASRLARAGLPTARLDARLLLGHVLGLTTEALLAHSGERPRWEQVAAFEALVDRRLAREPVAYIRGFKEFWSMELEVDPSVLIPRPDTEILVQACLDGWPDPAWDGVAADVGTGSGAVALALARERPRARVAALDASRPALRLALRNARTHGLAGRVALAAADLLAPVAGSALDGVAANLPYVPTSRLDDLDPGVRDHEPALALDGGRDGLSTIRRLVGQATRCLRPGGLLALEVADDQASIVVDELARAGWRDVAPTRDLGRLKRVVTARRAP